MSPQEHQVRHRQRQLGHRPKDRRHAEQLSVVGRRDSTDPKRRTEPGMRGERASSHDHERLMTDHEHESHPRVQWSVRAGASGREFTSSWRKTSRGGSELTCDGGGSRVRRVWRATPSGSGIGTPATPFYRPPSEGAGTAEKEAEADLAATTLNRCLHSHGFPYGNMRKYDFHLQGYRAYIVGNMIRAPRCSVLPSSSFVRRR